MDGAVGGHDAAVAADLLAETLLDRVEVDPQPEHLAVAVAPPDHLEEAVDLAGQVAGAQLARSRDPGARSAGEVA